MSVTLPGGRSAALLAQMNLQDLDHVPAAPAFITTFGVVARSAGVGACWIGYLPSKDEPARILDIHPRSERIALVPFGFCREKAKTRLRKRFGRAGHLHGSFRARGAPVLDREERARAQGGAHAVLSAATVHPPQAVQMKSHAREDVLW